MATLKLYVFMAAIYGSVSKNSESGTNHARAYDEDEHCFFNALFEADDVDGKAALISFLICKASGEQRLESCLPSKIGFGKRWNGVGIASSIISISTTERKLSGF